MCKSTQNCFAGKIQSFYGQIICTCANSDFSVSQPTVRSVERLCFLWLLKIRVSLQFGPRIHSGTSESIRTCSLNESPRGMSKSLLIWVFRLVGSIDWYCVSWQDGLGSKSKSKNQYFFERLSECTHFPWNTIRLSSFRRNFEVKSLKGQELRPTWSWRDELVRTSEKIA